MWMPTRPRRRSCHKKQGWTRLPEALGPALWLPCDLKLPPALGGPGPSVKWPGNSRVFPAGPGDVDPLQGSAVPSSHLLS